MEYPTLGPGATMTPEERQKLLAILAGHLLLVFLSLNLSPGTATPPQKLFTSNCIPTQISFRDVYLAPCFSIMQWRPFGGHLGSFSMGRKLQRLSRRTGVHAHSPCPQAKCRSCCPPRSLRHGVDVHFAFRCRLVPVSSTSLSLSAEAFNLNSACVICQCDLPM